MKKSFFTTAILLALTLILTACSYNGVNISVNTQTINGSGSLTTETRPLSSFSKVELLSIGNLTIKQGTSESLTIKADENLLPYITSEVEADTLKIGMKPNLNLNPTHTIEYTLTVKSLSGVVLAGMGNISADALSGDDISMVVSGSGDINVAAVTAKRMTMRLSGFGNIKTGTVNADSTTLELNGSGDLRINRLTANNLDVTISGLGNAELAGKVNDQKIRLTGSGSYRCGELESENANFTISGLGSATTWVNESLNVSVSGSGNIEYYGSPSLHQTISGVGSIKSLGAH